MILAGWQQYLVYKTDLKNEKEQANLKLKHEKEQGDLLGKLDPSLQREDDMKVQLKTVGTLLGNMAATKNDPQLAKFADVITKISLPEPILAKLTCDRGVLPIKIEPGKLRICFS
jgi:hypothetical protein